MTTLLTRLGDWFDDRTGYRQIVHESLYENVPGGSRWIYVTGSMLVFAFVTQVITGIFLWMCYSPGSQNAWESVYYISNEMQGGWLLRGVHHYMAQAMVVLLPLHLLQVVICRAYVAPREINYWLGLVLMLLVLGLGLTGYLLPWDQKGYWATKVATELMSLPPGGGYIQKLVVGGSEYGHATLTRFFAMHAGVLPGLLVLFLAMHLAMFRKHGITAESSESREDQYFWPQQVFKDSVACLLLLIAVVAITCWRRAELGPPAEPTESFGAARPEWYFLFLFQLLKKFESEFIGAIVVPTLAMAFLFALPLIAKIRFGHVVNVVVMIAMVAYAGYLTYEAIDHDNYHTRYADSRPEDEGQVALWEERIEAAEAFHEAKEQAHHEMQRIEDLVDFYGIPREGAAVGLVRNDPEIQGPRIFKRNCASCHGYLDAEGNGIRGPDPEVVDGEPVPNGAPNLFGFATPDWFMLFLDHEKIGSNEVFGQTRHRTGMMAEFTEGELAELNEEQKATLANISVALSAEAKLIRRVSEDEAARQDGTIDAGIAALEEPIDIQACTDCHKFRESGDLGTAPDLTEYGSYRWLYDFIANPMHERFYNEEGNDRMPAFAADPDDPAANLLSAHDLDMLVRWLRGDDRDLSLKITSAEASESQAESSVETPADEDKSAETALSETPPVAEEPVGMRLFRRNCARCHPHDDGTDSAIAGPTPRESGSPNGGPDLYAFASRAWLQEFLTPEGIAGNRMFGNTVHGKKDEDGAFKSGGMVEWVQDYLVDLGDEDKQALGDLVITLSAEASLPAQQEIDAASSADGSVERGRTALIDTFGCIDCHKFHDEGDLGLAPDLTGYGSRQWLIDVIANPEHERFYPESNDRMPAFAVDRENPGNNLMTDEQIGQIVDWLRGEPTP